MVNLVSTGGEARKDGKVGLAISGPPGPVGGIVFLGRPFLNRDEVGWVRSTSISTSTPRQPSNAGV